MAWVEFQGLLSKALGSFGHLGRGESVVTSTAAWEREYHESLKVSARGPRFGIPRLQRTWDCVRRIVRALWLACGGFLGVRAWAACMGLHGITLIASRRCSPTCGATSRSTGAAWHGHSQC